MGNMTDRDFTVWLRNVKLAISREAQARGTTVSIYADSDGYSVARFGDYEHYTLENGKEAYKYEPLDGIDKWRNVRPEEIRIGGEPL